MLTGCSIFNELELLMEDYFEEILKFIEIFVKWKSIEIEQICREI